MIILWKLMSNKRKTIKPIQLLTCHQQLVVVIIQLSKWKNSWTILIVKSMIPSFSEIRRALQSDSIHYLLCLRSKLNRSMMVSKWTNAGRLVILRARKASGITESGCLLLGWQLMLVITASKGQGIWQHKNSWRCYSQKVLLGTWLLISSPRKSQTFALSIQSLLRVVLNDYNLYKKIRFNF